MCCCGSLACVGLGAGWMMRGAAQIAADELLIAMQSDRPPLLLDLRSAMMIDELGPIAGAVAAEYDRLHMAVGAWPINLLTDL